MGDDISLDQEKKETFLKEKIFDGLTNLSIGKKIEDYSFSEDDFKQILEKVKYFGIGIYTMEASVDGQVVKTIIHEKYKKKTTNPKWFLQGFRDLKREFKDATYTATYRVSSKLIADKVKKSSEDLVED